jgi:hypothetical protein
VDRTKFVKHPIKWTNKNSWSVPKKSSTLDNVFENRVKFFSSLDKKINIFWSGGIDSTVITTAFLKFFDDYSKLRIIYSPWSCYEHPDYLNFLKKFPSIELVDISGEAYLDLMLDGIFITGVGGDEINASIDESFMLKFGNNVLNKSWKDLFYQENKNDKFIDFCQAYFQNSGLDIKTVLDARWLFYNTCKIDSIFRESTIPFLLSNKSNKVSIEEIYSFFNFFEYEEFVYDNLDLVIPQNNYKQWRDYLKDYCFEFDQIESWHQNKTKFHSLQILIYQNKKIILNDKRYIFILDNNNIIQTPNLPFLSQLEFDQTYNNSLDYLFNEPS